MQKSVILIGASGTIGSAIALELANDYHVIPAARSSGEYIDITDPLSVDQLFDRVEADHGTVDGIISAAGGGMVGAIKSMDLDQFLPKFESKLRGQVAIVKHGCRIVRPGGAIVLTTGILAQVPMQDMSHLSMINAALEGFVRTAAIETDPVRVCAVSPALVEESPKEVLNLFKGMSTISAVETAKVYREALESGTSGMTLTAHGS